MAWVFPSCQQLPYTPPSHCMGPPHPGRGLVSQMALSQTCKTGPDRSLPRGCSELKSSAIETGSARPSQCYLSLLKIPRISGPALRPEGAVPAALCGCKVTHFLVLCLPNPTSVLCCSGLCLRATEKLSSPGVLHSVSETLDAGDSGCSQAGL